MFGGEWFVWRMRLKRTSSHEPLATNHSRSPQRALLPVCIWRPPELVGATATRVFLSHRSLRFGGSGWVSRIARRGLDAGVEQVNFRIGHVFSWLRQPCFQASPAVRASRHAAHSHPWGTARHRLLHATRSGQAPVYVQRRGPRRATSINCRSLKIA